MDHPHQVVGLMAMAMAPIPSKFGEIGLTAEKGAGLAAAFVCISDEMLRRAEPGLAPKCCCKLASGGRSAVQLIAQSHHGWPRRSKDRDWPSFPKGWSGRLSPRFGVESPGACRHQCIGTSLRGLAAITSDNGSHEQP